MKFLITAFDPFGDQIINPSQEILRKIPDTVGAHEIIKLEIQTAYYESIVSVLKIIDKVKPDVVISLGQAGGRSSISIERIGLNLNDCTMPDNLGVCLTDTFSHNDGPLAYMATVPVKAIVSAIRENGIPCDISNTAGLFVCNHVMYNVLHYITKNNLPIRAGFIHIPYLPQQVITKYGVASMNFDDIMSAIILAINTTATISTDTGVSQSSTH